MERRKAVRRERVGEMWVGRRGMRREAREVGRVVGVEEAAVVGVVGVESESESGLEEERGGGLVVGCAGGRGKEGGREEARGSGGRGDECWAVLIMREERSAAKGCGSWSSEDDDGDDMVDTEEEACCSSEPARVEPFSIMQGAQRGGEGKGEEGEGWSGYPRWVLGRCRWCTLESSMAERFEA